MSHRPCQQGRIPGISKLEIAPPPTLEVACPASAIRCCASQVATGPTWLNSWTIPAKQSVDLPSLAAGRLVCTTAPTTGSGNRLCAPCIGCSPPQCRPLIPWSPAAPLPAPGPPALEGAGSPPRLPKERLLHLVSHCGPGHRQTFESHAWPPGATRCRKCAPLKGDSWEDHSHLSPQKSNATFGSRALEPKMSCYTNGTSFMKMKLVHPSLPNSTQEYA